MKSKSSSTLSFHREEKREWDHSQAIIRFTITYNDHRRAVFKAAVLPHTMTYGYTPPPLLNPVYLFRAVKRLCRRYYKCLNGSAPNVDLGDMKNTSLRSVLIQYDLLLL